MAGRTGRRVAGDDCFSTEILTPETVYGSWRTADTIAHAQRTRRERAIEELHSTARVFMRATTEDAIAQVTVDTARTILNMPASAVHFDDGDGLYPGVWTEQVEELIGTPPVFEPGDGLAWQAFETGEARVHDDITSNPNRYNPETDIRSELILPLGDHGVLLMGSSGAGGARFGVTGLDPA